MPAAAAGEKGSGSPGATAVRLFGGLSRVANGGYPWSDGAVRVTLLAIAAALVCAAPSLAAKPLPDLVVTKVTKPSNAVGGSTITIRDTVVNKGKGSARSSVSTFYLSFDKKLDDNDIKLEATRAVKRLPREKTSVGATKAVVPTYLTGLFEVLVCADSENKVKETNEKNNCRAARAPLQIQLPPQD